MKVNEFLKRAEEYAMIEKKVQELLQVGLIVKCFVSTDMQLNVCFGIDTDTYSQATIKGVSELMEALNCMLKHEEIKNSIHLLRFENASTI